MNGDARQPDQHEDREAHRNIATQELVSEQKEELERDHGVQLACAGMPLAEVERNLVD